MIIGNLLILTRYGIDKIKTLQVHIYQQPLQFIFSARCFAFWGLLGLRFSLGF